MFYFYYENLGFYNVPKKKPKIAYYKLYTNVYSSQISTTFGV